MRPRLLLSPALKAIYNKSGGNMLTLKGKGASAGIARGPLIVYERDAEELPANKKVENVQAELSRFVQAQQTVLQNLQKLQAKALQEIGEEEAAIFDVHQLMVTDLDYVEGITNLIKTSNVSAAYAVAKIGEQFAQQFAKMDDEYMQGRSADVRDITNQLLVVLGEHRRNGLHLTKSVILVVDDLSPSETLCLDKSKVLGFVTISGSTNSHTAILARTLGIPAVVGTGRVLPEEQSGTLAIIDGNKGLVYLDPDLATQQQVVEQQEEEAKNKEYLTQMKGLPTITQAGQKIKLCVNIGQVEELPMVERYDAEGVGLFRSEFIYLGRKYFPSEEELFVVYKQVAASLKGKKAIIRTLDIGADKKVAYFNLPAEENPALGLRAIRLCLMRPRIFEMQLRALLRASAYGKISIMLPMIISLAEVQQAKAILERVKENLRADKIKFDPEIELGIMIETPAAAVISDLLAAEVDFFSIGTNDLVQYTLAVDRQNAVLNELADVHHPAVLRLIELTIQNAHKQGIWVGICGEAAADTSLTAQFVAMGVDELSVVPNQVLTLRKLIREL